MAWVATAINGDGTVTEFDNEFRGATHGTHVFRFEGTHECFVWVHDNTRCGLVEGEAAAIADLASKAPIYWSDFRCCHWMYNFQCCGHWVEGLFPNNGLHPDNAFTFKLLQVNVYE